MKVSNLALATLMGLASTAAWADAQSQAEAGALLDAMGMQKTLSQSVEQMLDAQLRQNAALRPFRGVMLRFFDKYMSYEALKPELVKLYGDAYTAKELREIAAFYKTPVGKKSVALMPELMAKGSEIGLQMVQSHSDELRQMVAEEAERLQKKANPNKAMDWGERLEQWTALSYRLALYATVNLIDDAAMLAFIFS